MKVLFAIDTLGSGGAQRQAVELAVRLVERGDVEARFSVYHADPFFRPRLDAAGIDVTVLPKSMRYDPLFPRRMRADLRSRPVDLVHAFLLPPCLWALLALRGLPRAERPAFIAAERNECIATSAAETAIQRFVYRRADLVTVNASPVAAEIERRCRVQPGRIEYVPNGIDLAQWDRAATATCPLELEAGLFHIGVIGRIAPEKNHDLLLEALGRIEPAVLKGWRVWLIGAGAVDSADGRRLARRARSAGLGDVVRFQPPQREIAAIMARLSLLALSSRNEGFPNVVLEAMASRVPVVATRVGDVPSMLEHDVSGWIVPPGDAEAFARALLHAHALGPRERAARGAAGRTQVERRFSMDAIADRYLQLYARATASGDRYS